MKAYRAVLYVSVVALAVATILPLITLREFQGHIWAWLGVLGVIAPAALLVLLLVLSRRLSPRSTTIVVAISSLGVAIAWALGRINIRFFALYLLGALAILWSSRCAASVTIGGRSP